MKEMIINPIMNSIRNECNYDEIKLEEIKYGLSSLYLAISKTIVIFSISYLLGYLKTLLILMGCYSYLRLFASGVHAKRSIDCWISSLLIFLLFPYLCENIFIPLNVKIYFSLLCLILLSIYAPADTEKRPLINAKKRKKFKILSILNGIIFSILIIIINDITINNCIWFSLLLITLVVLPISYKLFGVSYNNYKNYKE